MWHLWDFDDEYLVQDHLKTLFKLIQIKLSILQVL